MSSKYLPQNDSSLSFQWKPQVHTIPRKEGLCVQISQQHHATQRSAPCIDVFDEWHHGFPEQNLMYILLDKWSTPL